MAEYSRLGSEELDAICSMYAIHVSSYSRLDGGNANSSYLIDSADGRFVVTVLDNHDHTTANALVRLTDHLVAHGIDTPTALASRDGRRVIEWNGTPLVVKPFARGSVEVPLPARLVAPAGALLARIHAVPPPGDLAPNQRRLPATWRDTVPDQGSAAPLHAMLNRAELALNTLEAWRAAPVGLAHGDLFADNLVASPEGELVPLDWETASVEPLILDIGFTIVGLGRNGSRLDSEGTHSLLAGYKAVRHLEPVERLLVVPAVRYANAVLAFHRYLRHNVRFPDVAKRGLYLELVEFDETLRSDAIDLTTT
jgi:homoserine kinase type II